MVKNLYRCFIKNDATLIEINPLVLTTDNQLVAGDCKMVLDDAARFRHSEWQFEAEQADANFVVLDPHGTIATVANGAGLAMATVDAVVAGDMTPANFLDIGGGASTETVLAAFRRITEFTQVKAIVINIFAGITRCDEVARAIVAARDQIDTLPPLCIRLAGTNYEEAAEILAKANITLLPTLQDCIDAAKEANDE
jgi:succinyl-CoA synthetase beta subunit